uniref:Adenylate kinase active site lid domain-containing protein n=1 Tax=Globisporangium ultimum (strain ATCC 200006 / CBS 805.95 / DAOM BR144) TaxID=431595 RepID=K3X7C4_GLOUD
MDICTATSLRCTANDNLHDSSALESEYGQFRSHLVIILTSPTRHSRKPKEMLQVFINGPPGSGKTTLCRLLCAELHLEPVSTGDLLKENIAQHTELGRIAKECISSKSLVPDHVVVDMVAEKVLECNLRNQGWVLDGFPRTSDQCAALRRKMISPSVVIILELLERECTKRITGRRFDGVTGKIYHLPNVTPKDASVLARLTKRGDDTSDKLPPRFEAYRTYGEKTNALFSGVAHCMDASKPPEELLEELLVLLHSIRPVGSSNNSSISSFTSGFAAVTIRGSQQQQQQAQSLPVVAPSSQVPKKQPLVPQKIEEENENVDDEADAMTGVPEYNYDCDDAEPVRLERVQEKVLPPEPQRSMQQRRSSSTRSLSGYKASETISSSPNAHMNNNDELPSSSVPIVTPPSNNKNNVLLPSSSMRSTISQPPVDMAAFKDMLLDGFEVFKHGRRGSPHTRVIFTDMEFKRIFWQKPMKDSKATKKAKLDQSIVLADVVQVVRGMKTEVLKRSGDVAKYERYLSLVADDRTLDMELPNDAICEFLLRGFDALLHGSL